MLHPAPPWSGYLEAGTAGDTSTPALPQCEAPSTAASIPAGSAAAAPALARSLALLLLLRLSLALLLLLWLSLDPSLAQLLLLLLSLSLVLLLCSIKPHFSRLNRLLGQSIFRGWGARRS